MTGRSWRCLLALLLLLPLLAPWAPLTADAARKKGKTLRVGELILRPCADEPGLWCGTLAVPLDRDDREAGQISIGFAWKPAQGRARGTLVAQEGGPGYPSIASYALWRGMFGSLLKSHNLLMVDPRGTGMSRPIDCPSLQEFDNSQSSAAFFAVVADCGRQLDRTFRHDNGEFVHASDLFGTVDAVDDMAAVIAALRVGPVSLYGDSYGSFFAQAFTARHPELLRAVVLDGTWPLVDADPWYPETLQALRFAFDAVCQRSAACRAVAPGRASERLAELAALLAETPLSGQAPREGKKPRRVTVTARDLAAIAWSAGTSPSIYRDLDAAARAALAGDALPLLRMASRAGLNGTLAGGWPVEAYSVGAAVAVPCIDYPQPYDMRESSPRREEQYAAAVAALPGDFFWPFANDDWLNSPIQDYNQCVPWPALEHERELAPEGFPLAPPSLPVLVLAGDLDTATALGGAEAAVRQLGRSARLVVVPSSTHVVAQGDIVGCGSSIVRAFLRAPERLDRLDVSCVDDFPEIRASGIFPLRLADQPLPEPAAGNAAPREAQRLAALAVATAGDAITYPARKGQRRAGLRGGTISRAAGRRSRVLTLDAVRFAEDVAVSGTITLGKAPAAPILARLVAVADDGREVQITATWRPLQPAAVATVTGWARGEGEGKRRLRVTMPAP